MAKKITIDPFYDGAGGTTVKEGVDNYTDVTDDVDIRRLLPSGPAGLKGTVVPGAAAGGAPVNWTATREESKKLHIDPDIPGQNIVVDTAELTPEAIEAARSATAHLDPRIRPSAIYNVIAAGGDDSTALPMATPVTPTTPKPVTGPLSAFNTPEPENLPTVEEPSPVKMSTTSPTKWVTFEIEGFGEHRAPYHRVIRSNNTLVLVYDTNCEGAQRFFPRTTEQPLGIHVEGESTAYYAHTTGIEFSDGSVDYCVLLVEHEAPLSVEQANED